MIVTVCARVTTEERPQSVVLRGEGSVMFVLQRVCLGDLISFQRWMGLRVTMTLSKNRRIQARGGSELCHGGEK